MVERVGSQRPALMPKHLVESDALCCIPHCQRNTADGVSIQLCPYHIQKAWAAHLIITGQAEVPEEEPEPEASLLPKKGEKGTIYFVRRGDHLKIGWTRDLRRRLNALKVDAVFHTMPGFFEDEKRMHQLFAAHLAHGRESFYLNPSTKELLEQVRCGNLH